MGIVEFCIKNAEGRAQKIDWIIEIRDGKIPGTVEVGLEDIQYASDVLEVAVRRWALPRELIR